MQKSDSIAALAAALAKAQGQIGIAAKTSEAEIPGKDGKRGYRYRYADLAAVWDACRGPLSANGLSVLQVPQEAPAGQVRLLTLLLHESGEYIGDTMPLSIGGSTPQAVGSALSYLRRYALAAIIGIVADDDDDGQQAAPPPAARSVPPRVDTETGEVRPDTAHPIARIREQLRMITRVTGDPCASETAKDFTRLSLRQLDEFSVDLARILDECKAGTLTLEWAEAQDLRATTRWKTQTAGSLARRLGAAFDLAGAPAQS